MNERTIELKVPIEIVEVAEAIAKKRDRSAESLLVEAIALAFGEPTDMGAALEAMKEYEDEQLLEIVNKRMTSQQEYRLRELLRLGQSGRLSDEEAEEMEGLLDLVDAQMLMRSEALLQLKRRGHDIGELLQLGA